jgi:DNA adenine methylase
VTSGELASFLKWAGGKRWLVNRHSDLFPEIFNSYYEPFVGSGAVFFALRPCSGLISDSNPELINLYKIMKRMPEELMRCLKRHSANHTTSYYYEIRASRPRSDLQRAARTIYLNRTCWNGLYRVNLKGEFNVPRGTKDSVIFPTDDFLAISQALRHVRVRCCDFADSIEEAKRGDFVFVDPPYTVRHNNNGFVKYNESIFTWNDQLRLYEAVGRARSRGVKILLTNADHRPLRDLYEPMGVVRTLPRPSVISGFISGRRKTSELAVQINYQNE